MEGKIKREKISGFTLIELVIVIGILGVLVAVVISVLNPKRYLQKGRDTRRQSDLKMIQAALEAYYSQNNAYPAAVVFDAKWEGYLAKVPQDPQNIVGDSSTPSYCYELTDGGQKYSLCANSELTISGGATGTCNTKSYTYCLHSPF